MATVLQISSEDIAWNVLNKAIHRELDFDDVELSFDQADWAKFRVVFRGPDYHHSITPTNMRGFIDLQNALYRSVGVMVRNDDRITLFRNEEKEEFELIFFVEEGSSDLIAKGRDLLEKLGHKIAGKMSGRQLVIVLLGFGLLYFGTGPVNNYIQHASEAAKIDAEKSRDKALIDLAASMSQNETERMKIFNDAVQASSKMKALNDFKAEANDSILRNSGKADEVVLQGRSLDKSVVGSITRGERRKSQTIFIEGKYRVVGVDTTDNEMYKVRLENTDDHTIINAELEDAVIYKRFKSVIQKAEWDRKEIRVRMSARLVGEEIQDAKILKASFPRIKKQS